MGVDDRARDFADFAQNLIVAVQSAFVGRLSLGTELTEIVHITMELGSATLLRQTEHGRFHVVSTVVDRVHDRVVHGLDHRGHGVEDALPFDEPQFDQHALDVRARATAPENVEILGLLVHVIDLILGRGLGRARLTVVTDEREVSFEQIALGAVDRRGETSILRSANEKIDQVAEKSDDHHRFAVVRFPAVAGEIERHVGDFQIGSGRRRANEGIGLGKAEIEAGLD